MLNEIQGSGRQENKTKGCLTFKELSLAMVDFPYQISEDS